MSPALLALMITVADVVPLEDHTATPTPAPPRHLPGRRPDPLPAHLTLPPAAAPAVPTTRPVPLAMPVAAPEPTDPDTLTALVPVPPAPDPVSTEAAPPPVALPRAARPPRGARGRSRPRDRVLDPDAFPSEPATGTPPSARRD